MAAPPDWALGWRVGDRLPALRGLGRVRRERALEEAGLGERAELGEIGREARAALVAWLRARAAQLGGESLR